VLSLSGGSKLKGKRYSVKENVRIKSSWLCVMGM
jgi:hypothetical protein